MLANVYDRLNENGFTITPARGKAPFLKGWEHLENNDEWVDKFANYNVGIVLGDELVAIDIDITDEKLSAVIRASCHETFGLSPTRYGKRPKSLVLYRVFEGIKKRKVKFDFNGVTNNAVEILGNGQQFIAYGVHPDTGNCYEWDTNISGEPVDIGFNELLVLHESDIDAWLLSLKSVLQSNGATNVRFDGITQNNSIIDVKPIDSSSDPFAGVSAFVDDADIAKMREMLKVQVRYNPSDYDDWIKVGLALKRWNDNEGFELWREWSTTGGYDGSTCSQKWHTFKDTGGTQITPATLVFAAREVTGKQAELTIQEAIKVAGSLTELEGKIVDKIKNADDLSEVSRDMIIQLWRNKVGEFTSGLKPSLATTRKILRPIKHLQVINQKDNAPEWCKNYVWLNEDKTFFDIHTKETLAKSSFDANYNRYTKLDLGVSANDYALDNGFIDCVHDKMYMPQNELFFDYNGKNYVNSFAKQSIPKAAKAYSEEGKKAVDHVLLHLQNVCGNREKESRHLLDFIAYMTQNIGKKINYVPLFQGFEGDGKSTIRNIVGCCIGAANTRPVEPTALQHQFTGWAEGSLFVGLEELRLVGHSRFDVLDAIKPFITNSEVSIRRMGRDHYVIHNSANFMGFTNHRDALPLNDHDRRWWVIFLPWKNRADMDKQVGGFDVYFGKLMAAIKYHGSEIRKYFLEHQISADFNPNGHAPMTDEKRSMISAEKGDEIADLEAFINKGSKGYSASVISSAMLKKAIDLEVLNDDYSFPELNSRTMRHIFERLGFVKNPNLIKWDGTAHRVWCKSALDFDSKATRALLDATLLDASLQHNEDDF